jgi:hypothetical protein
MICMRRKRWRIDAGAAKKFGLVDGVGERKNAGRAVGRGESRQNDALQ